MAAGLKISWPGRVGLPSAARRLSALLSARGLRHLMGEVVISYHDLGEGFRRFGFDSIGLIICYLGFDSSRCKDPAESAARFTVFEI